MAFQALRQRGWFRTGALNIILASTCGIALLVCLAISLSKRELPIGMSSTGLFEGSCARVSTLSTIYHIGLNIISTGILSSSNFFMQIVSSPSRKDIDDNHAWLRPLSIGLPSPTNIPVLPRKKQICWAILLLSSVPIHLFFNSAIYSTSYQSTGWNVTIATDHFVQRGVENQSYWLPGASLAISGTFSPVQQIQDPGQGYGDRISNGYWDGDRNDEIRQEIAATARECAHWDVLDAKACMDEFRPDKYRTQYKNVAIIVNPNTTDSQGWKRHEIFEFKSGSNLTTIWDPLVPPDGVNSLWFWAPCSVSDDPIRPTLFYHSCSQLFGMNTSHPARQLDYDVNSLTFAGPRYGIVALRELHQGYMSREGARNLQIDHCLAEPTICKLRVSNTLLLITIICVVIKVATCVFVITTTSTDGSLVTLGDAIESFIRKPDPITKGLGTLGLSEADDIECKPREKYFAVADPGVFFAMRPRRWIARTNRLYSSVTLATWIQLYFPVSLGLIALTVCVIMSGHLGG